MSAKIRSAFGAWFEAQFGGRNLGSVSDEKHRQIVEAGRNSERILRQRAQWDYDHRAALYAWVARETVAPAPPSMKTRARTTKRLKRGEGRR